MLTVHKNTKQRRESKQLRRQLIGDAKRLSRIEGISGYSIVVWDKDCGARTQWQSSPPSIPGIVVPEFSKKALERTIAMNDAHDIIDERFEVE